MNMNFSLPSKFQVSGHPAWRSAIYRSGKRVCGFSDAWWPVL